MAGGLTLGLAEHHLRLLILPLRHPTLDEAAQQLTLVDRGVFVLGGDLHRLLEIDQRLFDLAEQDQVDRLAIELHRLRRNGGGGPQRTSTGGWRGCGASVAETAGIRGGAPAGT